MGNSFVIRTKHLKYWAIMLLMCFMIIVRNVLSVQFPIFFFLPVGFLLCLLCERNEIVAFMCSMAPFENTFQFRYMILIGALFLLIKSKRFRFSNLLPIVLMMICEILHFTGGEIPIASFLREFGVLVPLGIVLIVEPIDSSDGLTMRSVASMVLFASIITVIVNRGLTGYSFSSSDRLGSTYDMVESYNALLNPNVGSFLCVLSICGLVLLIRAGNKSRVDTPLLVGLAVFILLFQSKAAIISLVFAAIIYLYANNKNWVLPTLRALGILFIFGIIAFIFFRNTINAIIARFVIGDFSTGRIGIFAFYHHYLFSNINNLLFGCGLYNYAERIASHYSSGALAASGAVTYINHHMTLVVSHNNIQEIIIVWGIPGLLIVLWLLNKMIKHKKMDRNILQYLAFDFVLLYTLQGQLISNSVALIALIFSLVCMEYECPKTLMLGMSNTISIKTSSSSLL